MNRIVCAVALAALPCLAIAARVTILHTDDTLSHIDDGDVA